MSYQILNPNSANYAATVSSNETARMRTMIQEITGLQNNTAASFTGGISLESMSKARISNKVSKDNESAMNQLGSALAESLKGSTFFVSTENFDKASSVGGVKMKNGSSASVTMGVEAFMIAQDPKAYVKQNDGKSTRPSQMLPGFKLGATEFSVPRHEMAVSLENYDKKVNSNLVAYTTLFNMNAYTQDAYNRGFFQHIAIPTSSAGLSVSINVIRVISDEVYDLNTPPADYWNGKPLQLARIDAEILRYETQRLFPVYSDGSGGVPSTEADLVDPALIPLVPREENGIAYQSQMIRSGRRVKLVALGSRPGLVKSGPTGYTDALDSAVQVAELAYQFGAGNEVIFKNLDQYQWSTFTQTDMGDERDMTLNFINTSQFLDKETRTANGANLTGTALDAIAANEWKVYLRISVSGRCNLATSDTELASISKTVERIINKDGDEIDLVANAQAKAIVDLIDGDTTKLLGWTPMARLTNSNRRQRGKILHVSRYGLQYMIPLRSPITALRPVTSAGDEDEVMLQSLIAATRTMINNDAQLKVRQTSEMLAGVCRDMQNAVTMGGVEFMGVGRELIARPWHEKATVKLLNSVSSIKSSERVNDIRATLLNQIRDMGYRAYMYSGLPIAIDLLYGNENYRPKITVGCDAYVAQYLMEASEVRVGGVLFDMEIVVSTLAEHRGKIYCAFTSDASQENVIDVLNFGFMATQPELVVNLPWMRDGVASNELTVQPSYLFGINVPIMWEVEVQDITKAVTNRTPINVWTTPKP